MKIKNTGLEYGVFYQDHNGDKLKQINILDQHLIDNIAGNVKHKRIKDLSDLTLGLLSEFRWHFWSKAEYEVVVHEWVGKEMAQKIDVFYQIEPNIDMITDQINAKMELGLEE